MTSQVNPNNIDGTYPVAGQDNDSQGFRDNFTNIRNNFAYIKAEVEDLQNKVVLKSALASTTLSNDFSGNTIVNPALTAWRETYNNVGTVSGSTSLSFANGNFQKIIMSGSVDLSFTFPSSTSNQYASIKLWVVNPNAGFTLTLPAAVTLGDPDTIAGLSGSPPVITFSAAEIANDTNYLFEFYTVDAGTTIGIRDLTRNRDIDLSGMSITGNLALDNMSSSGNVSVTGNLRVTNGIFWSGNGQPFSAAGGSGSFSDVVATGNVSATGNIITTNGVFWAGNGAPFAPGFNSINITGNIVTTANVVAGGNVVAGSNTITNGGRINTNYAYVTLVNDQDFAANVGYQTIIFDTAGSTTIANARISLPNAAEDGREIVLSFLSPITSVWVNKNSSDVKWFSNSTVFGGNVTAKFIYSAGVANWLRST